MKKAIFTSLILMAAFFCTAQNGSKTNISVINHADRSGLADESSSLNGKEKIKPSASVSSVCGAYTVTDADGNVYSTVKIGDQCWMGENLRVGIMIPGTTNQANNGVIEKHCYGDLLSNCNTYGGLYQWGELMQYSGQPKTQGICPAGWNIPASGDFQWLGYLVGDSAGGKLKTTGTIEGGTGLWYAPNTMATNLSGFSAVPGGWKDESGNFGNLGQNAFFYTSEGWWDCCAYFRQLDYNGGYLNNASWAMRSRSLSVRCIKNAATLSTVSTSSISGITATTAFGGGNVTGDGGEDVTARGVVWSTTPNPTITSYVGITSNGTGLGAFTSNLTALAPGTIYYVRAYATNSIGTAYGLGIEFMTMPSILTVSGLTINSGTDTCFNAAQTINVSNITVKTGGSATFISGGNILLQTATKVENGGYLKASITTNSSYCMLNKSAITLNEEELPKEIKTAEMNEAVALFAISPNPTFGAFTLKMIDFETTQIIHLEVYSMMGEMVMQSKLFGQRQYDFDLSGRSKGVYFIRVISGDKMGVEKLIKQ
ncbi:MAG: T9SS type A sorting domain-containing protein [Bacteroidetes bacterium]|nr:T9SS type A sorting domain-containing protein [Bacteroidota bacterium]